jgi:mannose-6-phosphate isomerase-like protein (cupin superfamily)
VTGFSQSATFAQASFRHEIPEMKRENPTIEICPGITRRTVHILEGQMRLIVEGVPHELSTGDSFYLASNVPHGVETILPTRVLDTFSPPRNDYLAIDEKVLHGAL